MADWYATIAAEFKTLALATLPAINVNTFHTVVEFLQTNVISDALKAKMGDVTRLPPPYLILQLGQDHVATDAGPDARYYRLPIKFYFIIDKQGAQSLDPTIDAPAYARSQLELLRVAFQTVGNLTTCQWTGEDGEIDSSEDVAFASDNMKLFAAELTFETGFLTRLS